MANARFRPMISPILPPVIMNAAITSVYIVIAVWMPVTVVPTSLATVAIETFMTELSRVMRNCADASVSSTNPDAFATRSAVVVTRPPNVRARFCPGSGQLLSERCRQPVLVTLGLPAAVADEEPIDLGGHQRMDEVGGVSFSQAGVERLRTSE